ncbi:antitoxin of toxin-antitoxin stability system [Nitrospirillum sp. BR 11164]|uniref:antitoxin of toxin-antitoxin stability system n=1 Tax=Nitrospirillum sp. BR 11164 TaxID=3104324 RepID=UPI002AFE7B1C|nr:antitoxin of toxin-antitoxin stability system [Nitrospirillum sp. BR 11164]MEA1652334.1 antitoxin of toxin-antitoxin stability system [Nitrospirillum sp. BR 11164]
MAKEAMFTLKLEADLRDQFMAEAEAAHRPASQIVRDFMRDFVRQRQEARQHDAWFRAQVEQGLREADDPSVARIPHEQVKADWRQQRAELLKRAGEAGE